MQLLVHASVAAACSGLRSMTMAASETGGGDAVRISVMLCFETNDNISPLREGLFVLLAAGILLLVVKNIYMYVFTHMYLWDGHRLGLVCVCLCAGVGVCVCVCVQGLVCMCVSVC